jgi:hypothetical protein
VNALPTTRGLTTLSFREVCAARRHRRHRDTQEMRGTDLKRIGFIVVPALMTLLLPTTAQAATATTVDFTNAPHGTRFMAGTPKPTCTVDGVAVTCSSYDLRGVGTTRAEALLWVTWTALIQCKDEAGQVVEVSVNEEQDGAIYYLESNGRLGVPVLATSSGFPQGHFEEIATCPVEEWIPGVVPGSITVTDFSYDLTFEGFTEPAITVTGP